MSNKREDTRHATCAVISMQLNGEDQQSEGK